MVAVGRVLDDRGRLFGRVNIVDLVVLVVIIALVVFAAVRLWGGAGTEAVPVKVTFVAHSVDQALAAGMQTKGTVRDAAGNLIGQVQSVAVAPTIEEVPTSAGELKRFPSTIHSDVMVLVAGQGTVSDSTVHIGRIAARVGAKVRLVGPGYEAETTISNVVWGPEAVE